jgi:hypothetical protein
MTSELQRLRDRVEELEELLGLTPPVRYNLNITDLGMRLLGLLLKRPLVVREFAFRALYGGKAESDQPKNLRIIDVIVHRLNMALRSYGVKIQTEYLRGYYLSEGDKATILGLLNETQYLVDSTGTSSRRGGSAGHAVRKMADANN